MKKYFVQCIDSNGDVTGSMNTMPEIAEMFGFRDCTDCDYRVFDISEFGRVRVIIHVGAVSAPFNHHKFLSMDGEVVYEGYSTEH